MKTKNFTKTFTLLLGLMLIAAFGFAQATFGPTGYQEDFTGFTGAGFSPTPTAGQLHSGNWRVTGMSDGNTTFGGTHTTVDFARGSSTGGVTTGGVYAFDVGSGITILGVQPSGSDFTPGNFTLRLENTSGNTINDLNLSYDIYVYNNENRSSSLNFAYSFDDVNYTQLPALDYTTPVNKDDEPIWVKIERSTLLSSLNFEDSEIIYLKWDSDDVAGSGSRDEFGITNIVLTPPPYTLTLDVEGEGTIGHNTDVNQPVNINQTRNGIEWENCIVPPCEYPFEPGTYVQIRAVPEAGWEFVEWVGTYTEASITAFRIVFDQITIEMTGDSDVKAVFEQITYPLTINIVGNGAVQYDITEGDQIEPTDINLCTDAPCVIDVPEFLEVELNPIPDQGWVFDGWYIDGLPRSNSANFPMHGPVTATATFIADPYAVNTIVEPTGSGNVDVYPPGPYDLGSTVTFTASPSETFLGWDWVGNATEVMQRSGSSGNNPLVLILGGPVTVTGNFALMAVPISNWAVIVGLVLIIGFIAFRFRHLV